MFVAVLKSFSTLHVLTLHKLCYSFTALPLHIDHMQRRNYFIWNCCSLGGFCSFKIARRLFSSYNCLNNLIRSWQPHICILQRVSLILFKGGAWIVQSITRSSPLFAITLHKPSTSLDNDIASWQNRFFSLPLTNRVGWGAIRDSQEYKSAARNSCLRIETYRDDFRDPNLAFSTQHFLHMILTVERSLHLKINI